MQQKSNLCIHSLNNNSFFDSTIFDFLPPLNLDSYLSSTKLNFQGNQIIKDCNTRMVEFREYSFQNKRPRILKSLSFKQMLKRLTWIHKEIDLQDYLQ